MCKARARDGCPLVPHDLVTPHRRDRRLIDFLSCLKCQPYLELPDHEPKNWTQRPLPLRQPRPSRMRAQSRLRWPGWRSTIARALPRQAMQSAPGLERVKGRLRSYEDSETQQAAQQGRQAISYQFLWDALGLRR